VKPGELNAAGSACDDENETHEARADAGEDGEANFLRHAVMDQLAWRGVESKR
jgi:hypothetical protein